MDDSTEMLKSSLAGGRHGNVTAGREAGHGGGGLADVTFRDRMAVECVYF